MIGNKTRKQRGNLFDAFLIFGRRKREPALPALSTRLKAQISPKCLEVGIVQTARLLDFGDKPAIV
jgi:hypothetical protein